MDTFIKSDAMKLESKSPRIFELPCHVYDNFHDSMAIVCQWLHTHILFWS